MGEANCSFELGEAVSLEKRLLPVARFFVVFAAEGFWVHFAEESRGLSTGLACGRNLRVITQLDAKINFLSIESDSPSLGFTRTEDLSVH
jgi:hypothetical protein